MKTKIAFCLLFFWLILGASTRAQDKLDSLLADNLSDLNNANLYDLCYDLRGTIKNACNNNVQTSDNFQTMKQGRNLCLISWARIHLQVFIDNYLFSKKKNFSISLLSDDVKFVYLVNSGGDGGYFKSDPLGYLVINSIFMSNERFLPMTKDEIVYFNERVVKALFLTKKASD